MRIIIALLLSFWIVSPLLFLYEFSMFKRGEEKKSIERLNDL